MKNDPIQEALARLDDIPLHTPAGRAGFAKALTAKSNLVAAKAAKLLGNGLWLGMAGEIAVALGRLLDSGASADKGCAAKIAMARALHQLEHDDAQLFLAGMKCVQREPVWGGSEDVAADLRAVCAAGLAGSTYSSKLRPLVDLLGDAEWPARAGAINAIAGLGGETAALLLRLKALTGDVEVNVLSGCLTGLLELEGAAALVLVESFTGAGKPEEVRDTAILVLGASRRADAVEMLIGMFGRTTDGDRRKCILLALATSRSEVAVEFLDGLMREGTAHEKDMAKGALKLVRQGL